MTREQYLKIIEKEIHQLNKKIDLKILRGEDYNKEASEHKLLLRKIRQNRARRSFFSKFFAFLPQ